MKKQIIGTMLASAVILAAIGAAGFANDQMKANSAPIDVTVLPQNAAYSITDPLSGAIITDPNYVIKVETIHNEELRYFNCYGAQIATCGQPDGGNGVGYVSSLTVGDPNAWTTQTFDADFQAGQEGQHRLMVVGYIGGVAVDNGRYVDVSFFNSHAPGLIVQDIPGGSYNAADSVWTLPEGNYFDVTVSYNDLNSIGMTVNGKAVDTSNCQPVNTLSGMVTCRISKSDFPADEEHGTVTIVVTGKDAAGNVVTTVTINAIDPDIDAPNTGAAGGSFTFAHEDIFLAGVVALLAIGLVTVYILFRRSSSKA